GPGREAAAREAPADAFAGEVLVGEAVVDCDREAPPPREARGPRPVSAAPTAVASATPAACVLPEDPAAPRHEGLGSSSALAASWGRPAEGVSSHERPVQDERPRIEVRADIVIYGRAKPGTEVVIDGIVVPVRPDGTFDLRFALPARRPEEAPEPAGPGGPPGGARP
ncbi:MAG: hypothetical protein HY721_08945, partial [Planctomycetes bacterium]|nr:hypothetical protein [Planctomycetota bacterium]